ncbi:interferon-induced protein with tetratricopeptide repeats 5-like, partial [Arapaima gigas]
YSGNEDVLLKTRLLKLDCHFTWDLKKTDTDLSDLQQRIEDDINLYLEKKVEIKYLFNFLAFTKYLQDLPEEALENLKKAEEICKCNKEACGKMLVVTYGDFAWLYYHMGDYSASQRYLAKLEEVKKQFPPSVLQAAVCGEKGWNFLRYSRKYYEKAKECFQKALDMEPDDSDWNAGYAFTLYRTESDATCAEDSQAIKHLRRALELNPDDARIMALLGLRLFLYQKKSPTVAIKHYREASKLHKDTKDGKKCLDKLKSLAEKCIAENSKDDKAFAILGYVHQMRDEKREAIECYEKALSLDPKNEEYLTALCDVQLSLN